MKWNLISLFAAVITITSAQFPTIENSLLLQTPDNVTFNPIDLTDNHGEDDARSENTSSELNSTSSDKSQSFSNDLSDDNSTEITVLPEHNSNDISSTREEVSIEESESRENIEPDNQPPGTENSSPEKLRSDEIVSTDKPPCAENCSFEISKSGEDSNGRPQSRESESEEGSEQIIITSHGPVKGHVWHESSEIIGFIDIQYGKFNTPFAAPVTAQAWEEVHHITEHTKRCPQVRNEEYIGDQNCLTLSIFTPKNADNVSVLFHIYDSYSESMSADPSIYGPEHLVSKGIILVLPNYRFGPMGFLCMQNETAPGNAGLKDLTLALEWVKDNIHLFGGNSENIVVSGDGAAGAYAGYLALSSRSKNNINKVITESGSALSHWALDRDPIGTAYELADKLRGELSEGVIYNNTFDELALETIMKAAKGMRLNPCLDKDEEKFMDDTPWKMIHNDKEISITFMIGSAIYAGMHEAIDTTEDLFEKLNDNFETFLPDDLIFDSDDQRREVAQQLKKQYFEEDNITLNHEHLALWHTDASYLGPGIRMARPLLSSGATVYIYEFAFAGALNRELETLNESVQGAVRSDIVGYLFHKDGTTLEEDSAEKHMVDLMVDLWISFINTGKPGAENVEWNEFKNVEDTEEEWLFISSEPELKKGVHVDRLRLWTTIYHQHFIENNSALRFKPHYYLAVVAALMCWIANDKLNYSNH